MRRFLVLAVLFCVNCTDVYEPLPTARPETDIRPAEETLVAALHTALPLDSLPSMLGWPIRSAAVMDGNETDCLVLMPLDADDEQRVLAAWMRNGSPVLITAVGFQETTWFSPARAETLSVYEGWVHWYDLAEGGRRISAYYEGGVLLRKTEDFPMRTHRLDALGIDRRFAELVLASSRPPRFVRPRIFLSHVTHAERWRMIAAELRTLFAGAV